jgi:hypothetical protein
VRKGDADRLMGGGPAVSVAFASAARGPSGSATPLWHSRFRNAPRSRGRTARMTIMVIVRTSAPALRRNVAR